MYRVCEQGMEKYYAIKIEYLEDDLENIKIYTDEGTPVIFVNELEDLAKIGISGEDIILVDSKEF